MEKNLYFVFTAAAFALLVSAPGRLAYGLVLIIEMLVLAASSSYFSVFIKKMNMENLQDILTLSFMVFVTILYKQLVILFSPVLAFDLGLIMFFPVASVFFLGNVFSAKTLSAQDFIKQCLFFSAFAFFFFLLRDILGYGTISFPIKNGILEIVLFNSYSTAFLSFFASVPGALFLVVVCMSALLLLQQKINVIEKAGDDDGDD